MGSWLDEYFELLERLLIKKNIKSGLEMRAARTE